MKIPKFKMEEWLGRYRFDVPCNLAESGVRDITVGRLFQYAGKSIQELADIILEDEDTYGTPALRELISATYRSAGAENILVTTGTSEALFVFYNTILSPGDTVIAERPSFQALWQIPASLGCHVKFVDLRHSDGYSYRLEDLSACFDEDTKLVIINTPHNPSGKIRSLHEISEIAKLTRAHDAVLLVDEHYRFLPLDAITPLPSAADLNDDIIFVTGSITKCFGMIGLRMGWIIGSRDVLSKCRDYRDYLTHVLSPVSDRLSRLALKSAPDILNDNIALLINNRTLLEEFVSIHKDKFEWVRPQAGAVVFPKLVSSDNGDEFVKDIIERAGVFLLPGSSFGYPEHFRMCIGVDPACFAEALERIDSVISRP